MKEVIRLTNKTAVALRKSAQRVRTAYFAAAVILSLALGALGIFLGLMWLPAVPLCIAAAALLDCALMIASRSRYLSMIGQAICTEAAAREIRAGSSADRRREQALRDLMRVKEDVQGRAAPNAQQEAEEAPAPGVHRRRRNTLQIIRSGQ